MNNVFLEFQDITSGFQEIYITRDITRLGREPGLEIVLAPTAANVSRRHAEIRHQEGIYFLVDLGSFNGTFLNGRRIVNAEVLHESDVIQLGPGGPAFGFVRRRVRTPCARPIWLGCRKGAALSSRVERAGLCRTRFAALKPIPISHGSFCNEPSTSHS